MSLEQLSNTRTIEVSRDIVESSLITTLYAMRLIDENLVDINSLEIVGLSDPVAIVLKLKEKE